MLKNALVSCFLLVGIVSFCAAQTVIPEDVKTVIKARVDNGVNVGIVVGTVDASGTRYHSYGVKSLKTKEPVDENSVFEIGSISKTFTGIILADKVIKGEMKLDDPLQKYLPAGVTAPTRNDANIKLVNMSNHTSALPRMPDNFAPADPANPFADYTEKQMYDFLTSYKLTRDIGSQYEYSNYAVGLLGFIMATKNKTSYEQMMMDVIGAPLDLKNTRITFSPNMKKNLAMGHSGGVEVSNWDIPTLAGAGAIRSTTVDMIKYISANMGMLKSKLYPAMQLSHTNSRVEGATPMVGLGWHIMKVGDKEIIWHNGGTGGYRTFCGFVKGDSKGVVVLSNSNESVDDIGFHLLAPASPLKTIKSPAEIAKEQPPVVAVDAAVLETYVGKYELAPGFILTISRKDNQLSAQATGQQDFPVFAKSKNEFYFKVVDAQITFNTNKDGVVESVTLHQGGQHIPGKRLAN